MTSRIERAPAALPGLLYLPRDAAGRVLAVPALERFASKCQFDSTTGCVIWTGGRTRGRGNSTEYGSFWDAGRRWFAHRWAAVHIHGFDLSGGETVGHCCKPAPNSLCVQHLEPQTLAANIAERNTRVAALARQTSAERQYWLLVERGYEQLPAQAVPEGDDIPFFAPPDWLRPYLPQQELSECPF